MGVIIGMDPHKRSATIEVIDDRASVLAAGQYETGKAGYAEMLGAGRRSDERVWAIEGCNGAGPRRIAVTEPGPGRGQPGSGRAGPAG